MGGTRGGGKKGSPPRNDPATKKVFTATTREKKPGTTKAKKGHWGAEVDTKGSDVGPDIGRDECRKKTKENG